MIDNLIERLQYAVDHWVEDDNSEILRHVTGHEVELIIEALVYYKEVI